ncbi:hypothetical protein DL95DRAFT_466891 [Leptodontidium sp. 2 PMI_412]|nr:hypothetical protein DL95DRAFT_466891 [Leptodontidium sp. 2 PMI_412]
MTREIFLVAYAQPRVPAHWSMWIPECDGAVKGKKIHAIGNPFQGYFLEIKSYDISKTTRAYQQISLGSIHDDWVPRLDSKAGSVPTPGVSRTPLDAFAVLVRDQVMDQSALDILRGAPKS